MSKYQLFFNTLNITLEGLNPDSVKATIGDSINNNRVLTVGQLVRFLNTNPVSGGKTLGASLENVYGVLRNEIITNRLNSRTDAVDINEFINFYEAAIIGAGEFRPVVSKNISL